jgi:hypothetical protein
MNILKGSKKQEASIMQKNGIKSQIRLSKSGRISL